MKKRNAILMIALPIVICICFILIICLLYKSEPAIEVVKQSYHFPSQRVMYDEQSFEDGKVVYLACDKNFDYTCEIKQEKYPYGSDNTRSCNVTLNVDRNIPDSRVYVVPFGDNKTILSWKNRDDSVKISVVHLNGCIKTEDFVLWDLRPTHDEPIIKQLDRERKIVTYNDTFDVFYKDQRRCFDKECKLTINDKGKGVKGPVGFMNNIGYRIGHIRSIVPHSPNEGYVYSKTSNVKDTSIFIMRGNDTEKELGPVGWMFEISVVNKTIGVCSRETVESNIICSQYDANGELKFTFEFECNNVTQFLNMYTLPDEGFLLQLRKLCEHDECESSSESNYFIVKVAANTEEVGQIDLEEYNNNNQNRYVWKNQDKGVYCDLMLDSQVWQGRLNITSHCFTDANFSC